MANTYTQLYVQFVFPVNGWQNLIKTSFKDELEKVMCGIISKNNCKTYAIYCNPDHTHIFVGMHPNISPSKLMEQVKSGSSKWLNGKKYIRGKFSWQDGFGAFSYSKSHIDNLTKAKYFGNVSFYYESEFNSFYEFKIDRSIGDFLYNSDYIYIGSVSKPLPSNVIVKAKIYLGYEGQVSGGHFNGEYLNRNYWFKW